MTNFILSILVFLSTNLSAQTVPKRVEGKISDVYCGAYNEYGKPQTADWKEACVLFIKELNKAVVLTGNGYLGDLVPSGEENSILIGRNASFSSCEETDEEVAVKIKENNFPENYEYIECYKSYTKLTTPNEVAMKADIIAGEYRNSKGDKATVKTEILFQPTLFSPAVFYIEVYYENKKYDQSMEIGPYNGFKSDEFLYVNNAKRPYFLASYADDCDDEDCYNTDGTIKFLKNKKGDYTLYLNFSHYNNAPLE